MLMRNVPSYVVKLGIRSCDSFQFSALGFFLTFVLSNTFTYHTAISNVQKIKALSKADFL